MGLEQDPSGLTMYNVMDQRRSLATVLTLAGAHTTVVIAPTCPSHAPTSQVGLQLGLRIAALDHLYQVGLQLDYIEQ